MFIFCLFAVTLAQKALIVEVPEEDGFTKLDFPKSGIYDLRNAMYLRHEVDKCIYISANEYVKYEVKNNKVTESFYSNDKCTGNVTRSEDKTQAWQSKYVDAPAQKGFRTEKVDDDKCSHEASMSKVYYKDGCNKVDVTISGTKTQKYVKFYGEEGKFYFNTYDDDKCDKETKFNDVRYKNEVHECDKCKDKYKYQCGSVATMILAVFAILAFFF